ncbi:MAG TPA: hypothetical protein VMS86_01085 [Thermoanaerobaculia bacterium]|nr:hypothetical protein [Thermoanaerobaculia bacterium]
MTGRGAAVGLAVLLGVAAPGAAATHLLVVSGLGGDETYSASFHEWSLNMIDGALAAGVPLSNVMYLAEDPSRDERRIAGDSRKATIESTLRTMGDGAGADGELWIVIFGHGSARGGEATVNLPGPDLSGGELAAILDTLPPRRIVVVNASSASGEFVRLLSAPGRAIVTATRSVTERHAPVFGKYFSESFVDNQADLDKDGRVSLLEAFEYARAAVERFFEGDQRLRTEHALLDDDGDGRGSMTPAPAGEGDGVVASRLFLGDRSAIQAADASPELRRLRERKDELEERIAELRARRGSLEEGLYLEELETLLLDLARTNQQIERLAAPAEESS